MAGSRFSPGAGRSSYNESYDWNDQSRCNKKNKQGTSIDPCGRLYGVMNHHKIPKTCKGSKRFLFKTLLTVYARTPLMCYTQKMSFENKQSDLGKSKQEEANSHATAEVFCFPHTTRPVLIGLTILREVMGCISYLASADITARYEERTCWCIFRGLVAVALAPLHTCVWG